MDWISILILILIVVTSIFILTYTAHRRGSSMCFGCHGDCSSCKKKDEPDEKADI